VGSVPLAERVRQARVAAGLTQAQLAGGKVAVRTISRIERGHVRASARVLAYIAGRVGRPLRYFVDDAVPAPEGSELEYLLARGAVRRLSGDPDGARRLFAAAVALAARTGDQARHALARLECLSLDVERDHTPENAAALSLAQAEAERFGHVEAVARSYIGLAAALESQGLEDGARAALDMAWQLLDGRFPEVRMLIMAARIRVAVAAGRDTDQAARDLDVLGRACDPRSLADVHETSAERAYAADRVGDALAAAQHALAIRRCVIAKAHEAEARCYLAHVARRSGRTDEAINQLTAASVLAREVEDRLTEAESLVSLCGLHARVGNVRDAARTLEEARTAFLRAADETPPVCTTLVASASAALDDDERRRAGDEDPPPSLHPPAGSG